MKIAHLKSRLKKVIFILYVRNVIKGFCLILLGLLRYIYCVIFFNDGRIALYCDLTIGLKNLKKSRVSFPHPIGIVIGKGVGIGYDCKIFQGVTIGSKLEDGLSYPRIGNNVTIYANSVIVGGVTIGDNVTIGASTLVLQDIPSNSIAVGNPARIISK